LAYLAGNAHAIEGLSGVKCKLLTPSDIEVLTRTRTTDQGVPSLKVIAAKRVAAILPSLRMAQIVSTIKLLPTDLISCVFDNIPILCYPFWSRCFYWSGEGKEILQEYVSAQKLHTSIRLYEKMTNLLNQASSGIDLTNNKLTLVAVGPITELISVYSQYPSFAFKPVLPIEV
jgi:hypothetical protein